MSEHQSSTPSNAPICAKADICDNILDDENSRGTKKISPDVVAKFPYSFLEESQGDSSLEPGEVKTPPHDGNVNAIDMQYVEKSPENTTYNKQNNEKASGKARNFKTVSQLEAEMCKEKVRAILELDAIRRKDEVEKRKLQKGILQKSNENNMDKGNLLIIKEDRKKLKKCNENMDEGNLAIVKEDRKKFKKSKSDRLTEQSFHYSVLERDIKSGKTFTAGKKYVSKASTPGRDDISSALEMSSDFSCMRSDVHLNASSNLQDSDSFVSFRSMNPFMHGSYSDFQSSRRYLPRNRAGSLNCFRFSAFRPQYFSCSTVPSRHQSKAGSQYSSLPTRGRSPIQTQKNHLLWTKVKPSISYAFNSRNNNHSSSNQKLYGNISKSKLGKSRERAKYKEVLGLEKTKKNYININDGNSKKKQKIENIKKELRSSIVKSDGSNTPKNAPLKNLHLKLVEKEFASDNQKELKKKIISSENANREKYKANIKNIILPGVLTVTSPSEGDFQTHTPENKETIVDIFADSPLKVEKVTNVTPKCEDLLCKASEILNETNIVANCETPPSVQNVISCAGINRGATNKLQEIQDRIDKLLQDDDLKIEIIQATKEKLLEKTSNYVKGLKQRNEKILSKNKNSAPINSFGCSFSQESVSKSKDPETESVDNGLEYNNSKCKTLHFNHTQSLKSEPDSINPITSVIYDNHRGLSDYINASYPKSDANRISKYKNEVCSKLNETDKQLLNSSKFDKSNFNIFEEKIESDKYEHTVTKQRLTTLSLPFLKDTVDDVEGYKKDISIMSDVTKCENSCNKEKTKPERVFCQRNSPDTDDYSDNWENEDVESNFTPRNDFITESNMCKFVNPSPPISLRDTQMLNLEIRSTTPTTSPPDREYAVLKTQKRSLKSLKISENTNENIVQEIHARFLNSEEKKSIKDSKMVTHSYNESKSISTSSSTSPSSSNTSTSSTSSSSTTSSSTSSSDESNDNYDGFHQSMEKINEFPLESVKDNEKKNKVELAMSVSCELMHDTGPITSIKKDSLSEPHSNEVTDIALSFSSSHINTDATKELKKLKILESNLSRIQMMRANYDCVDEISEELSKMEKLFSQERKLLLQKCAKQSSCLTNIGTQTVVGCNTNCSGSVLLTSQSDSQAEFTQSLENGNTFDMCATKSNIFDSNRETIKLTISPIKLSKTSAILKLGKMTDNEVGTSKNTTETTDDTDFTEKLLKPVKEVAIVKPIMESKELQLKHSNHRKSSHSIGGRRRSPNYRDCLRRSPSRSRCSPHHDRVRSLSISPSRRSNKRYVSPQRRYGISSQIRYRNIGRRTRSRSRSVVRLMSRKMSELSPVQRRRRQSEVATDKYRKNRTFRGSRSPLSPVSSAPVVRQNRQGSHSPARSLPLSLKHCSQNRGNYSRSPLPFKPPSPPTNRSLSPIIARRHNSFSPNRSSPYRSSSGSPSHSPRMSQSSHSLSISDYDDCYRSRFKSYDRHSLSPEHEYYSTKSPKSHFYNPSPNRMSLDARINIVLNGQSSNHERSDNEILPFEGYTSYTQYGGATYMSLPSDANSYYTNQYVHITNTDSVLSSNHLHQTYSNLENSPCNVVPSSAHQIINATNNFYYNEFDLQPCGSSKPSPLLKELPKATVAVQKGNVLEIVPSNEILPIRSLITPQSETYEPQIEKEKSTAILWKNEITDRQKRTAAIRLARKIENSSRGILKKSYLSNAINSSQYEKVIRKQVYFEDGIYPNHDSDCEDRKVVEAKMRIKMRSIRKKHGVTISRSEFTQKKSHKENIIVGSDVANLPPLPPSGVPAISIEQPVYIRPLTPTPLLYFHFDSFVHSMYVSQMERPIPPRLLNPKCLPLYNVGSAPLSSPLHVESPNNSITANMPNNKMDSAANSTSLGSHRHDSAGANLKVLSPIEYTTQAEHMLSSGLSNLNPIIVKNMNIGTKQQPSSLRWVSMRMNNMHLPHSPLTRDSQMSTNKLYPVSELNTGAGQLFDVAPPSTLPTTVKPQGHTLSNEYPIQSSLEQQQCDYHHHNSFSMPLSEVNTSYASLSPGPQIPFQQRYLPIQNCNQNQVSNYLLQEFSPQLPIQTRHLVNPMEITSNACKVKSPQAMVVPFNVKQNVEE